MSRVDVVCDRCGELAANVKHNDGHAALLVHYGQLGGTGHTVTMRARPGGQVRERSGSKWGRLQPGVFLVSALLFALSGVLAAVDGDWLGAVLWLALAAMCAATVGRGRVR